jgi:hypothetical protein
MLGTGFRLIQVDKKSSCQIMRLVSVGHSRVTDAYFLAMSLPKPVLLVNTK